MRLLFVLPRWLLLHTYPAHEAREKDSVLRAYGGTRGHLGLRANCQTAARHTNQATANWQTQAAACHLADSSNWPVWLCANCQIAARHTNHTKGRALLKIGIGTFRVLAHFPAVHIHLRRHTARRLHRQEDVREWNKAHQS